MSDKRNYKPNPREPTVYQIRIKGHLDQTWENWFEHATITPEEDGDTLLTLPLVDQAALHGLLRKIRDLGLPLLSVNRIVPDQNSISSSKKEK